MALDWGPVDETEAEADGEALEGADVSAVGVIDGAPDVDDGAPDGAADVD